MRGQDRQAFLHNLCTNDIRRLTTGEGCEAFCTDVKGKIVAHVYVLARDAELLFLTVPGQAATLIAHLDRYIIREDVQLHDQSDTTCWLWIAAASEVLADSAATTQLDKPWQSRSQSIDGVECLIARYDLLRSTGYLLCYDSQFNAQVQQHLQSTGAPKCSEAAWHTLRIESGVPLFGADFSAANLPQEIDRDRQAISFNKGCYLGQETIARIDALGHVNQKIVLVQFAATATAKGGGAAVPETGIPETGITEAGIPQAGMELTVAGKNVGQVTSSCWSPHFGSPLALATVRRGSNATGNQLDSALGVATVIAPLGNVS
jgi:folate-binding protein YgfZ